MQLTDIASLEEWEELERSLHEKSGMNACVYDPEGSRITSYAAWANKLCPLIKSYEQGVSAICAVANQYFTSQAKETGEAVISECDAGLVKFALPIFWKGEFLGTVGGCGHCLADSEVDTFLIHKTLGLEIEELDKMAAEVETIEQEKVNELVEFMQEKLNKMLA